MKKPPAVIARAAAPLTARTFLRGVFRAPGPHSDAVLALPLCRLLLLAAACLLVPSLARMLIYQIGPQYTYPVNLGHLLLFAALLAGGGRWCGTGVPYSLAVRIVAASTPCVIIGSIPGLHWPAMGWQLWLIVQRLHHYCAAPWRRAAYLAVLALLAATTVATAVLCVALPEIPRELRGPFYPLIESVRTFFR
ncbi:MAG TPA: hypothetical protein PKM88_13530 [bacterium]|nr:hypothetical protein [bacterium]